MDTHKGKNVGLSDEILKYGFLKFELLSSGVNVSLEARKMLDEYKTPLQTRSGASGGLDIILPNDIHVNCPINDSSDWTDDLLLDVVSDRFVIMRNHEILCNAQLIPNPKYYQKNLFTDNIPMKLIGQMSSSDRFGYGMTGSYCSFWKPAHRCRYCSIGLNKERDLSRKSVDQLLDVLDSAINDPILPAKHIMLGGGTPNEDSMGAKLASELCREIKKKFEISCYVMIAAPLKNDYIDMLYDSGVDELGINMEVYSDEAWEKYIPGKLERIGKPRTIDALQHAVDRFGPINTRSLLIVGLEDPEFTINGSEFLASMGVMPILSPFRPIKDTILENHSGFDAKTNFDIYVEVHSKIAKYNIPTGPTCIPCQNNSLALPIPNSYYRYY